MNIVINIVCIKWGTSYGAEYVNKLHNMIVRNSTYSIKFHCFTDDSMDFNDEIIVKPLPVLDTLLEYKTKFSYRKEAALCDDNLGDLNGERVFFFDLDMVMISNIDELFNYPEENKFYIINDWNTKDNSVGQASCYSWVVGTVGYVKKYFEDNPKEVVDRFTTASQEYLSSKIIEKEGKLNFWPEDWFCSFRFHCMHSFGPLRHFIDPSIPKKKDLKVIVFHGVPNPHEAINGIWNIRKGQEWKRLYKFCRPTKWIENFWY
jgi:hypothetical protein